MGIGHGWTPDGDGWGSPGEREDDKLVDKLEGSV